MITPNVESINAEIIAQLEIAFNQSIPLLPKAFNRVLAKVLAGAIIVIYKYSGFMALQQYVRFAVNEDTLINGKMVNPLVEWGRTFDVGDPVGAVQAEHTAEIVVTTQGGTLSSGEALLNAANGVTYLTVGDVALDSATKEISIRASADQTGANGAGALGNLALGATVTFVTTQSNVESDAVVTAQTTAGADAESTEVYRQRILDYTQKRPQGGAFADYELWGEEVAGIINVYPYKGNPGEVDLYSEATVASSGSDDGYPTAAQLLDISDHVETTRPVGSFVNSLSITRKPFDVTVSGLAVENQTHVEGLITSAIEQYFKSREPFIAGLSIPPRRDRISQTELAGVVSNVVAASNGIFVAVLITSAAAPITLYQLMEGEKASTSSVTFP